MKWTGYHGQTSAHVNDLKTVCKLLLILFSSYWEDEKLSLRKGYKLTKIVNRLKEIRFNMTDNSRTLPFLINDFKDVSMHEQTRLYNLFII